MSKNKYVIGIVFLVVLALMLYGYLSQRGSGPAAVPDEPETTDTVSAPEDEPVSTATPEETQLPNPASVHCIERLGGTLDIFDTSEGQIGICTLPDGRRCEEWELYRTGDCTLPTELERPIRGDKGGDQVE